MNKYQKFMTKACMTAVLSGVIGIYSLIKVGVTYPAVEKANTLRTECIKTGDSITYKNYNLEFIVKHVKQDRYQYILEKLKERDVIQEKYDSLDAKLTQIRKSPEYVKENRNQFRYSIIGGVSIACGLMSVVIMSTLRDLYKEKDKQSEIQEVY